MVVTISLFSLLGVLIIPFIQKNSRLGLLYKYIITLMIAMGVAALASDALLHLIPHVSALEREVGEGGTREGGRGEWREVGGNGGEVSLRV